MKIGRQRGRGRKSGRTPLGGAEADHRPFTLVLGGGGARGFAHAGVLRALEHEGLRPQAVVGVSMGAVVGVAYAMREDWYDAVLRMRLRSFPGRGGPSPEGDAGVMRRLRKALATVRTLADMVLDWGPGTRARRDGLAEVERLVGSESLEGSRVPVAVTATDLRSGARVVLRTAPAVDTVYASGALAGVLPPLESEGRLLADGAYTDLAPIDVARELGPSCVIAVDPGQPTEGSEIRNGFQAIVRAMEICHRQHAELRFAEADLVLRPRFTRPIDTLDFGARRECVVAGIRVVRRQRATVRSVLAA